MQMYGNFEGFPLNTPQKTNVEPESTPLEKEKHLQTTNHQFFSSMSVFGGV